MIRMISGFAIRRPAMMLVVWIAIVGAGFGAGLNVFERLVADVDSVAGSESQRAAEQVQALAPRPEAIAVVVSGHAADDPALLADVDAAIAEVRALPGITDVKGPTPSAKTGQALLIQVHLAPGDGKDDAAQAAAARFKQIDAPTVVAGGGPLQGGEINDQAQSDVVRAELLTTPVLLVLLLVVFGGLVAAGLPLLIAVAAVSGTFGILHLFSMVTDISFYAIQITTTLAVGLAVDYALLVVNRFREERRSTPDIPSAIAATMATAGRTVTYSGLTVAVALAGLVVFPNSFLRSIGLAGAAVVLVDTLAAVTLLPALLALVGRRIGAAKVRPRRGATFAKVARGVQRRPVLILAMTAGAMMFLAVPVVDLRISAGDPRMMPAATQTRKLWDELTVNFPERTGSSEIQVVTATGPGDPALARLRATVHALPAVSGVELEPLAPNLTLLKVRTGGSGEQDTVARDTVVAIRALDAPFEVSVTGTAARLVDYHTMLAQRLPLAIALVVVAALLLLFAFTGSVILPIKAVLTNILSLGAALGVVVWVFQQGHLAHLLDTEGLGYVHLTVPVLIGAIAFGLSMDYEVFLLSRIRERWLAGDGPHGSVAEGLRRTGSIVTAAALILAVVFAGFLFGGFAPIKAIGLGLLLAVALDVTIVRMLLVPATMTVLGSRNWWLPRPLRRVHARLGVHDDPPADRLVDRPATRPDQLPAVSAADR